MPQSDSRKPSPGAEAEARRPPAAVRARLKGLISFAAVAAFGLWLASTAACGSGTPAGPPPGERAADAVPGRGPANGDLVTASAPRPDTDYSKFSHTNEEHARLPCLLCHRRPDNTPRPQLPGHQPCAGCHAQQFKAEAGPMCTICHTAQGSAEVKRFPALRSFGVEFDHARHASGAARPANGCVACHGPARGGVAQAVPAGLQAHQTCYQCHTPRAEAGGRDISSCATCHEAGPYRRTPQSARAFRVGFSHADHRRGLSCADCHTVRAGAARGRQVSSPQPLMHQASGRAQSCMTCHNNRRAFGGDDTNACRRCHKGASWGT